MRRPLHVSTLLFLLLAATACTSLGVVSAWLNDQVAFTAPQLQRQGVANAFLDLPGLRRHCALSETDRHWLENACERLGLSLRAAHRVLKVARTLADLAEQRQISREHLAEALQYRPGMG